MRDRLRIATLVLARLGQVRSFVVDLANALIRVVNERRLLIPGAAREYLDAVQVTGSIEERQLVADLAHAELDLHAGTDRAAGSEAGVQSVQRGIAISV